MLDINTRIDQIMLEIVESTSLELRREGFSITPNPLSIITRE